MNILDAFEKSDSIRRPSWAQGCFTHRKSSQEEITVFEILATDWEPVIEPLTFERIKREAVPGKTLFECKSYFKRLYLGFSRKGLLVTDFDNGYGSCTWNDLEIKGWQISSEKWEG